jgi:sulfur-carrier protein
MRIVYFASVREALGIDGEQAEIPDNIITIAGCLAHLLARGGVYQAALADQTKLRFALDGHMAKAEALISGAQELAIFPPVTGG